MVRDILENPKNTILTSTVTLAEIVSKALRTKRDHKIAISAVESNSTLQTVTPELATLAGEAHADQR